MTDNKSAILFAQLAITINSQTIDHEQKQKHTERLAHNRIYIHTYMDAECSA